VQELSQLPEPDLAEVNVDPRRPRLVREVAGSSTSSDPPIGAENGQKGIEDSSEHEEAPVAGEQPTGEAEQPEASEEATQPGPSSATPTISDSLSRVSWRAATDIRRLPTDDRLFERLDQAAHPGSVPVLIASAAWVVIGSEEVWDRPPSVPVLVTRDQLLVGRKAGRFAPRIVTKSWWCKDLILRGVNPVAGAEQYSAVELEHWIDGRISLVFGTRGECDVVAKLVEH
jgi:hypothetical protein